MDKLLNYDLILGRDILHDLGIIFKFKNKPIHHLARTFNLNETTKLYVKFFFEIKESCSVGIVTKRIKQILDVEYKKINSKSIIMNVNQLKDKQKNSLLELLQKFKKRFDGTLGKYTGYDYTIELKEDVKPYHTKPFPIPKIRELTLKKKINRLIKIGVLTKINNSQWAASTIIIPKNNGTVRFISDFRERNISIKKKCLPIPNHSRFITQIRKIQICHIPRSNYGILSHYLMYYISETMHNSVTVGQI